MLEFTHGGANCSIISVNVSSPITCSLSLIRMLKLLLVCAICLISCMSVSLFFLAMGESILGMKLLLMQRLLAARKAPISGSMTGSLPILSVSAWMNSPTVILLFLHKTIIIFILDRIMVVAYTNETAPNCALYASMRKCKKLCE